MAPDHVQTVIPKPPTTLGSAGRGLWRATLERFELDPPELRMLELACQANDDAAIARAQLREAGAVTAVGRYGQVVVHPAIGVARAAEASVSRLLGQLHVLDPIVRPPRTTSTPGRKPMRGPHQ